MTDYVLRLDQVDERDVPVVGGKGASLGALSKVDGIDVPPGFCVTAEAFRRVMASLSRQDRLDELAGLAADDRDRIHVLTAEIRGAVEGAAIPDDIASAIAQALAAYGPDARYAVRSSATAEDLPSASFAGQHDTYLDVTGAAEVLRHVARCWASLLSERAVAYRLRNGCDQRGVAMAVVVQRMVDADASGVLFTADPLTSNRKVAVVEAVPGLGEALVSGRVNAESYEVRGGTVGTRTAVGGERPVLSEEQVTELERLGRRIEAHFGAPQDIEWCLRDGAIEIVQSRPITTLFPVPAVDDSGYHVYLSVGHQQMMTDALKPLGISVWQLTSPAPMRTAGGRLFVDVTERLVSPPVRAGLLEMIGRQDPLFRDALETAIEHGGFEPAGPEDGPAEPYFPPPAEPIQTDPALIDEFIVKAQASLAALEEEIRTRSGPELFDFIRRDLQEIRPGQADPRSLPVIFAGMEAAWWINDHMGEWLGETNAADALTQSVPHNVTSEMGMALLDVADVVRRHPEVVTYLQSVENDGFLDELPPLPGGEDVRVAIQGWLDRYGMRCVGEIDITRPRWIERPATLVPVILTNVRNFEAGERQRRFDQGLAEARDAECRLLARLRELPDGGAKADETKRMIDRLRTFCGYREYPKYAMITRYFILKQAILREVRRLVAAGILDEIDDAFFLTFDELHDAVRTGRVDRELLRRRRDEFESYKALTPPRALTSDGETIAGRFRRDGIPAGALVGLAVSAGVVEGRARVVNDLGEADLEAGDILVTAFTDPSWSPVFLTVAGLVTEVGGQMTHGAVIAREYGLPAVVAVERATRVIEDGQRIRVHGTDGYVQILPADQQCNAGSERVSKRSTVIAESAQYPLM